MINFIIFYIKFYNSFVNLAIILPFLFEKINGSRSKKNGTLYCRPHNVLTDHSHGWYGTYPFNRSFKVSNYSLHSDQHNFDQSAFLTPKDLGQEAKKSKKSRKSHFFRTKITVKRPGQVVST